MFKFLFIMSISKLGDMIAIISIPLFLYEMSNDLTQSVSFSIIVTVASMWRPRAPTQCCIKSPQRVHCRSCQFNVLQCGSFKRCWHYNDHMYSSLFHSSALAACFCIASARNLLRYHGESVSLSSAGV